MTSPAITLGVYMPGEFVDWATIDADLELLQSHGVNTVWLTHRSAKETADFARAAERYGIRVVAALAELDGSVKHQRERSDEQIKLLAEATLGAWGDAPPPLAWGMCDEPKNEWMPELRRYVNRWWETNPNPVTTCPTPAHLEAASEIGCEYQACQNYVFRRDGTSLTGWLQACADNVALNKVAWAMGQAMSTRDHHRLPTPAETAWLAYSAIAMGCRGYIAFCWTREPGPEGFTSIAMPQMAQQLAALGAAFKRIAKWSPTLEYAVLEASPALKSDGGVIATFVCPGVRYLMLVSGPDKPTKFPVRAWCLWDVESAWPQLGWGVVNVSVGAGGAKLLRVIR